MKKLNTIEALNALPYTAVIETAGGYVLEKLEEGWYRPGVPDPYRQVFPSWLPAKVMRQRSSDGS